MCICSGQRALEQNPIHLLLYIYRILPKKSTKRVQMVWDGSLIKEVTLNTPDFSVYPHAKVYLLLGLIK